MVLGLALVGCGARGPTVYRPGMAPWQVYEASRKRCSKEDAPVTVDDALRARLAPRLDYPRFVGGLAPDKLPANVSQELDSNYRAIGEESDAGRRVVREALLAETAKKPPSSFFLMDMGHFLVGDSCPDTAASAVAYAAIDPADPIVQVGSQDLFEFGFALAQRGLPGTPDATLRAAMTETHDLPVPQHATSFNPTVQAVYLLAPFGTAGETAIAAALDQDGSRDRALEMLCWLGSPASVPAVLHVLALDHDSETLERAMQFLMTLGGEEGRKALQSFDAKDFAAPEQAKLAEARDAIPKLSFQAMRDEMGGGVTVKPASELRERFARMIEDLGRDDSFEPSYVLDSDLPRAELIEWLRATRAAQLRRQSNAALSDVTVTNALILALSLRER